MTARFPTPEEAEADPRLYRNQREVDLLLAYRSLPDHLKPEMTTFLRRVVREGVPMEVAAIDFMRAAGLSEQAAVQKVRLVLRGRVP